MKNFSTNSKNKNNKIYIAVFLIVLTTIFLWFLIKKPEPQTIKPPVSTPTNQESEIQKQAKELEELRSQNKDQAPKNIEEQAEELKTLRQNSQPLSQTQVEEQASEINKLRSK